jgi:hypothetical protein
MEPCRRPLCPEPALKNDEPDAPRVRGMFCSDRCVELWNKLVVECRKTKMDNPDDFDGPPN